MEIEQRSRKASPALALGYRHRQNFGFTGRKAREDEPCQCSPAGRTVRNDVALGKHALDLVLAPAALKRGGMQCGNGGGVTRAGFRERGLAAREQTIDDVHHRRGSLAASWGW